MNDFWINIVNSNGEYFKNTKVTDAVLRTGLESQNILIGPFNGGENCVMQIKNTGMTINGNILSTGEITTSNISVDVLKFSNSLIKYDSNISNIVFGTSSNMVSMGGLLYAGSNLSDVGNIKTVLGNIGMSSNDSVSFSNVAIGGTMEADKLGGNCISSFTNSTLQTTAASSAAVKTVYDLASIVNNVATTASNVANAALPKAGGIVTGDVILLGTGTQILGAVADTIISPTFSWTGDSNTGLYHDAIGSIGIAINGFNKAKIDSSGLTVAGNIEASSLSGTCISSTVNSILQTTAASSAAVKTAYDLASTANNVATTANSVANTALPKAGGIVTGDVILLGTGTQILGAVADTIISPTFSWTDDSNTGLYHDAVGSIGVTINGLNKAKIDSIGLKVGGNIEASSLSGTCISSVVNSTLQTTAASSAAVKTAYDLATLAKTNADLAIIQSGGTVPNFTGQHRCLLEYNTSNINKDLVGLVVVSDKNKYISSDMTRRYSKTETINDALPVVSLSTKKADNNVFGVISSGIDLGMRISDNNEIISISNYSDNAFQIKGDNRLQINSIGEGCIWVIEDDNNNSLESGDYVMSSDTPGYSTLQSDDFMRSYTIAKITRSCNWNPQQVPIEITKKDSQGNFVHDPETNQPIFETVTEAETTDENGNVIPEHLQTEDEYTIRYVDSSDGSITTKEAWLAGHPIIKRAALLGCTYHCG